MNTPATGQQWSAGLPVHVKLALEELIAAAQKSFGPNLRSMVMFGSGAEGRLRATSDVNLLIILKQFEQAQVDPFRDPLRVAHAAAQASAMFVLETELGAVSEAFAVKFSDIARRHRLLCGDNLLGQLEPTRLAKIQRLQQVVLNTLLRLRERYVLVSLREPHLALTIAEMAGPLRSAAATLLELEGKVAGSSREALQVIAQEKGEPAWLTALELLSQVRESRSLPPGKAAEVMFVLMAMCQHLRQRLNQLA